ncbi:hypothetical protein K502DRAFT_325694 [Neoconidiobolus thromboides FSU 785]|nr:hypothetical protein K502DRAFT_325694 [Neoconidiobolus thromboides FSU 785]
MAYFSNIINLVQTGIQQYSSNPILKEYSILEEQHLKDPFLSKLWRCFNVIQKSTLKEYTLFLHNDKDYKIENAVDGYSIAERVLKRFKTLKHPDSIQFIEGYSNSYQVSIVTERVEFLGFEDEIIMEPFHCFKLLKHVVMNQASEWKLFNLQFLGREEEKDEIIAELTRFNLIPKEITDRNNITPIESYQLGNLLFELFEGEEIRDSNNLRFKKNNNKGIQELIRKMIMNKNYKKDIINLLNNNSYFRHFKIEIDNQLNQFTTLNNEEKQQFYKKIQFHLNELNQHYIRYKIIFELSKFLKIGLLENEGIQVLIKLSELEPKLIVKDYMEAFKNSDRKLRFNLLLNFHKIIHHFNEYDIKEIYHNILLGLKDNHLQIKELSLKVILLLLNKLNKDCNNSNNNDNNQNSNSDNEENNNNNNSLIITIIEDIYDSIKELQFDKLGIVRANTILIYEKIIPNYSNKITIYHQIIKSLKDPFPPSRINSLNCLILLINNLNLKLFIQSLLPNLIPLLMDTEKNIRIQAKNLTDKSLLKVDEFTKELPDTGFVQEKQNNSNNSNVKNINTTSNSDSINTINNNNWTNWAVNNLSKGISYAADSIQNSSILLPEDNNNNNNNNNNNTINSNDTNTIANVIPTAPITTTTTTTTTNDDWGAWGDEIEEAVEDISKAQLNNNKIKTTLTKVINTITDDTTTDAWDNWDTSDNSNVIKDDKAEDNNKVDTWDDWGSENQFNNNSINRGVKMNKSNNNSNESGIKKTNKIVPSKAKGKLKLGAKKISKG